VSDFEIINARPGHQDGLLGVFDLALADLDIVVPRCFLVVRNGRRTVLFPPAITFSNAATRAAIVNLAIAAFK
jgi:hypothetical protein